MDTRRAHLWLVQDESALVVMVGLSAGYVIEATTPLGLPNEQALMSSVGLETLGTAEVNHAATPLENLA